MELNLKYNLAFKGADWLTDGQLGREIEALSSTTSAGASEAFDAFMGNGPLLFGGGTPYDPNPAKEEAEAAGGVSEALRKLFEERKRAAEEAKAQAAADRAAAEAARELERADAELQRRLEEMAAAQAQFVDGLDTLEAQMSGPLAEAELEHARRMKEVQSLLDQGIITVEEATRAQLLYGKSFAKTKDQIDPYGESLRLLLEDLKFEYDLMGKTNAERITELELRRLGIDMTTKEGQAAAASIKLKVEALEKQQQAISAMDDFRASFEDNVASVLDGSKSIKDALRDMVDDFIAQLARMAAQRFTESLFGQMGSSDTGSSGGWLSALFGAFTARASGGPVFAGQPYLVGEEGPELVVPRTAGTILPADRTAAMAGVGQSMPRGGDTFVIQGATSGRSIERIRIDRRRAQERAAREFG